MNTRCTDTAGPVVSRPTNAPKFTLLGRAFILDGYACGFSPAMQALHEHACGWLQTVDGLSSDYEMQNDSLLARQDAMRAADIGFRGDDARKARAAIAKAVGP